MDWKLALSVTLVGMTIVFLALVCLWLIVQGIGAFMSRGKKDGGEKSLAVKPEIREETAAEEVIFDAGNNDEEELVAVITAAIAQYESGEFRIKSIVRKRSKRVEKKRSAWALEGMRSGIENRFRV